MPFAAAAHAVCASPSGMKKPQASAWGVCVVEVRSEKKLSGSELLKTRPQMNCEPGFYQGKLRKS
jgi:hypothetical protein